MRVKLNQKRIELSQNELSKKELSNVAPASEKNTQKGKRIQLYCVFILPKKSSRFSAEKKKKEWLKDTITKTINTFENKHQS